MVMSDSRDPKKKCILNDLVISVSNIYRDYSGCRSDGTSQDCDVTYTEFPNKEEFPLYYPSSSLVNTICRYSTRGMKWINQRYSHYTKSEENIDRVFNGANEKIDNISLGVLGPNYYNEETGLCNFTKLHLKKHFVIHTVIQKDLKMIQKNVNTPGVKYLLIVIIVIGKNKRMAFGET